MLNILYEKSKILEDLTKDISFYTNNNQNNNNNNFIKIQYKFYYVDIFNINNNYFEITKLIYTLMEINDNKLIDYNKFDNLDFNLEYEYTNNIKTNKSTNQNTNQNKKEDMDYNNSYITMIKSKTNKIIYYWTIFILLFELYVDNKQIAGSKNITNKKKKTYSQSKRQSNSQTKIPKQRISTENFN